MAQNHGVYVFPYDCTDFTTTGLVGDIRPLEATFEEQKNGISEVGNILKVEVPVRIPPVIRDDEYANTTNVYTRGGE